MRKLWILAILGALAQVLPGCGDDDIPIIVIEALSDQNADGDIGFSAEPPPGAFTITQANVTGNVQFGIDASSTAFRAFLDFPLDGATGGGVVPLGAVIVAADVDVFVNSVDLASPVPTLLQMVSFPITGLEPIDYDSPALASRSPFDFFRSDVGGFVRIDVTSLMQEAQRRGFSDLQLRFLLDPIPGAAGLVNLDDSVATRAPLLTVAFQ